MSGLCCSFLKANFVKGFLCVASLPESVCIFSIKTNGVDGSPRLAELHAPGVAPTTFDCEEICY